MSMKAHAALVCMLSLTLFACSGGRQEDPTVSDTGPKPVSDLPTTTSEADNPVSAAPSKTAEADQYAFTVMVTLSDAARKKLGQSGESVIVGADYFADPAANADKSMINEIGAIDLGRREVEIAGEGKAVFDGSALKRDRLAFIKGEPQVNVNVWSGRKSSPDNLLNCDMFQDAIKVAASKPVTLHCRLIDEPDESPQQQ